MVFFRSILFQILFWTFSIIINLLWLPSLLMPRRAIVRGMEIWARVSFWLLKHVAGLDYEVRGRENIAPGAALYASKHLSMWETIAPHVLLNDPATIMKRELLSVPFYGWYAQKCEMIVINRAAQAAAVRTMIADAKKRVAEGRPIFIFPEGTRVEMGAASDYKPGVAALYSALGLPCVPVIHNSALFWPRRGLMRKPGRIIVEFLPAIAPGLKRPEFMAELQKRIEEGTARLLAEGGFQPPSSSVAPSTVSLVS